MNIDLLYYVLGRSQVLKLLKEDGILEGVNINFNKELGRGSYTTVYQAEWRGLSCVAKVFHAVIFPSYPADTWKQLAREIELLQHIRHPNIVQLLGFTETQSKIPYVVMECLNTNLTTLIKEHHSLLSFDMQVCILHDIAVGLNFLHSHKEPIIHRDLSSNNILLTEHLVPKISDLGLAKHIKSAEHQAGLLAGFGTQDYMPPEVLGQMPPQISPKTDVFSFGVVMLQVTTGKPPDVRGLLNVDAEAVRRKHHLDMLSENKLFRPLVMQCLSNKSSNRPTAIALCEDLKRFGVVRKSTLKLSKAFEEERVKLTNQLFNKDVTINDLHTRMLELQQQYHHAIEKLKQDNQQLGNTLERTKAELQISNQNNMALKKHLDKAKNKRDGAGKEAIKRATEESAVNDATINGLRTRMLELQQQYHHSEQRNLELGNSLERAQEELQKFKQNIMTLKRRLEKAKNERDSAIEESATKHATINNLHTRMLELSQQHQHQHAMKENRRLKRYNQELENALDKAQEELQIFDQKDMTLKNKELNIISVTIGLGFVFVFTILFVCILRT